MVRVVRLERTVSWSQTRRDTNFAIPGYSISAMIPRRRGKSKFFLSVVIYVVKADFIPLSAIGENPENAGAARLCGVSPHPIPDTTTALPNAARYQLRYTPIVIKLWSCKWSNLWSNTFLTAIFCFPNRPKSARLKGFRRFSLSCGANTVYAPKASALPTALHPDTVFALHRKSVFDSPNSILDFGRKVNRPVAYPARIAYNKNITQYIKERAL